MAQSASKLSAAQLSANRTAIHGYIAKATAQYGRGSVILLPEFEEQANGEWTPVQGTGIRPTSNNSAFLRFGKMGINQSTGKPMFLYTNHFGDNEGELQNMLLFIDPTATIGSAVKGMRLVVHEQTTPFSRTNPARDIKWANQNANLMCTKNVVNVDTAEVVATPIYRRTKVFFADDEGNYPDNAKNILIAHDNQLELSENAAKRFAASGSNAGLDQAKAARIAELKAKTNRTKAEKLELAELED